MPAYDVRFRFDRGVIRAVASTQMNLLQRRFQLVLLCLATAAIYASFALHAADVIKILALATGCWLFTSMQYPVQSQVKRATQALGGKYPMLHYCFFEDYFTVSGIGMQQIPYDQITQLIRTRRYLYLLTTQQKLLCIVCTALPDGKAAEFRSFLEKKSGLVWKWQSGVLSFQLPTFRRHDLNCRPK